MATISLLPAPGLYAEASKTVSMTASDYQTILVSTTSQPAFTKNIAYDSFSNPFISVLEDGKGNVLFDGGFPKYYNESWTGAATFASLDNRHKLLYNAFNWLSAGNAINTPKSILIYGDAVAASTYSVKGTALYNFRTTLQGVAALAGFTTTFIDISDYSSSATIPYATLAAHSSVVIFSTQTTGVGQLSAGSLTNLQTFRQNGGGIMVITDHDVFQATANQVASLFGASFSGNVDRTPVSVDYLVSMYGTHPLWANMTGNVFAGASEGVVTVPTNTPFNPATQTIAVTGPGYKNVYVTVSHANGLVTTQTFSYALQVPDPVSYTTALPLTTVYKYLDFPYEVTRLNSTDTSGFASVNGNAIGEFLRTASGNTQKTWFSPTFKPILVNMGETNTVTVRVGYPVTYSKSSTVTTAAVNTSSIVPAERWASLRQYELAQVTTKGRLIQTLRTAQGLTSTNTIGAALKSVNKYYAAVGTTPAARIITAGTSGTVGYGYERRSNVAGTTYGSINSTANMFSDLSLNHFANYIDNGSYITSIGFVKESGAAQQPSDYTGKRLRVLDANGVLVFDQPFSAYTYWFDYGGVDGAVMFFASTKYIHSAGGQWTIQVV